MARVRDSVTLSAGGACHKESCKSLCERADLCLYQSKRQGRDCWHLAETAEEVNWPETDNDSICQSLGEIERAKAG